MNFLILWHDKDTTVMAKTPREVNGEYHQCYEKPWYKSRHVVELTRRLWNFFPCAILFLRIMHRKQLHHHSDGSSYNTFYDSMGNCRNSRPHCQSKSHKDTCHFFAFCCFFCKSFHFFYIFFVRHLVFIFTYIIQ